MPVNCILRRLSLIGAIAIATTLHADTYTYEQYLPSIDGYDTFYGYGLTNNGTVIGVLGGPDAFPRSVVVRNNKLLPFRYPEEFYITDIGSGGRMSGVAYIDLYLSLPAITDLDGNVLLIEVPEAYRGIANGISNSGSVAGYYTNDTEFHGFVYKHGKFTTWDYPGAGATFLADINDRGMFIGTTGIYSPQDDWWYDVGFVADDRHSELITVSSDPWETFTPKRINDRGRVVGTILRRIGDNYLYTPGYYEVGQLTYLPAPKVWPQTMTYTKEDGVQVELQLTSDNFVVTGLNDKNEVLVVANGFYSDPNDPFSGYQFYETFLGTPR